jgi:hypothetical protein
MMHDFIKNNTITRCSINCEQPRTTCEQSFEKLVFPCDRSISLQSVDGASCSGSEPAEPTITPAMGWQDPRSGVMGPFFEIFITGHPEIAC